MLERDKGGTAVIILNYNGWADTIDCVTSVLTLPEATDIVVVDNDSPDGSDERLQAWAEAAIPALNDARLAQRQSPVRFHRRRADDPAPRRDGDAVSVTLLQAGRNGGYAAGNNVGIRFALDRGCDFVWLLNNDTVVETGALWALLDRVRQDGRIGLCGSTLVYFDRPDTIQACAGGRFRRWRGWSIDIGGGLTRADAPSQQSVEAQISYINGASTLATRDFLETVGLMEESYFLYCEELDWAFRSKPRFRLGYAPGSVVRHKVGGSIGTRHMRNQSQLADFYLQRSTMLVCLRYSRISLPGFLYGFARDLIRLAAGGRWGRLYQHLRALAGMHYPSRRKGVPKRTARA